ncbi:HTH-type transcriptional regulator DmlR [Paraburkholderia nemoris]|uniref:LysR family transcriptional regulator n=1 Tax=Paraburkholderia nemoris TaxID=2793076 RepID=UPI001912F38D|nr:LysR family transcriptional regulator [Paraburkholderia nemoris]MBK5148553.1 LysR family transcriptional regulator [Burkholderia sp. R-69608]CAE6906253.1 HTH-type transcriptional regulator DmlR [Paraburkholderia nemoris]
MDYVESLRHFRAVVEAGSFTRAADMLGVAAPAVSRGIASLEQRLGARLFHRTTRQVSMTETGERFYERASRILDELDAMEAETLNEAREPTGVLRVVAHTTATLNRLGPLIAGFKRSHPKVNLDVTLIERPIDLVADGFDLGIVVPYMLTTESTVTKLLERIPQILVAAPEYLSKVEAPTTPTDLVEHTFVAMSPALRRPSLTFRVSEEEVTIPINAEISSNNPLFNKSMLLEGFGLGVVPGAIVQNELLSGQLVPVLPEFPLVDAEIEIRLAYNSRTFLAAKVKAFLGFASKFYEASA